MGFYLIRTDIRRECTSAAFGSFLRMMFLDTANDMVTAAAVVFACQPGRRWVQPSCRKLPGNASFGCGALFFAASLTAILYDLRYCVIVCSIYKPICSPCDEIRPHIFENIVLKLRRPLSSYTPIAYVTRSVSSSIGLGYHWEGFRCWK